MFRRGHHGGRSFISGRLEDGCPVGGGQDLGVRELAAAELRTARRRGQVSGDAARTAPSLVGADHRVERYVGRVRHLALAQLPTRRQDGAHRRRGTDDRGG